MIRDTLNLQEHQLPVADISLGYMAPVLDYIRPWIFKTFVDILVVVDEEIATQPGAGFGIGHVIELIRNSHVGCMHFRVDIALRDGQATAVVGSPAPFGPKYVGFRFDMQDGGNDVLDKYEQVWCFGFKPSNSGSLDDAEITQAGAFPASNAELAKLAAWMKDRKGGLFATGDHHFLGASMCRQIPRVGTMRRWTNADGVPPIGSPDRIDTLRPPSPAYEPSNPGGPLALGNGPHQGDLKVQPIQWVAWQWSFWPIFWRKRPHPLLCHPILGPINVMPDHAHEGLCVENPPLGGTYNFDGAGAQPEYPPATGGGPQPKPQIIAYGSTLGDPPYNFSKGPQPARSKFPMISVYDGHLAGVGRVATDSTWHHWMDVNIEEIKNADTNDWKLIQRYFINLAVWLNPPGFTTRCFYICAFKSHFAYPGFQEYQRGLHRYELGRALKVHLSYIYGPCWVRDLIWWKIRDFARIDMRILEEREPPRFPLGVIDGDLVEEAILGRIVEQTMDDAEAIKRGAGRVKARSKDPDELIGQAVTEALADLGEDFREQYRELADFSNNLFGGGKEASYARE
jgi:hypothetical protein